MAIYAIDFDNTLAITRFPEIIAPNKKMVAFAKAVKAQGHQIILWTSRAGADLENAVEWCRLQGLVFDAVNEPLPEQIKRWGNDTRKIYADYYIDDKNMTMDNFTSDSPVTVKQPDYYEMVKEAAKAELITNAVNAEVPGYYIQAMITGKKPDFLNTLDAEEEETGFRTEYEQITGAVVSIFEAWEKENGVESAADGLHRLIDDLSKNRIEELRVIRENREAENAILSKLLIPPLCGDESRAEETESEGTQHDADGSSTEDKRTE